MHVCVYVCCVWVDGGGGEFEASTCTDKALNLLITDSTPHLCTGRDN